MEISILTTIIIDHADKKLYTDSRCTHKGDEVSIFGFTVFATPKYTRDNYCKVFYNKDGHIITGSGNVGVLQKATKLLLRGKFPKLPKGSTLYHIQTAPNLTLHVYEDGNVDVESRRGYSVTGSGRDFAGAMLHESRGPAEAMRVAKELDPYSGGQTQVYDLSGRWYDEDKC